MIISQETMAQASSLSEQEGDFITNWALELINGKLDKYDVNELEVAALIHSQFRCISFLIHIWESSGQNTDQVAKFLGLPERGGWNAYESMNGED